MKKSIVLIIALFVFLFCGLSVKAQASKVVVPPTESDFTIELTARSAKAYAGAEFALTCGEGVKVKAVSYSKKGSAAGPTEAKGYTWFSLFSSDNDFTGSVTATVICSYSGQVDTSVALDHVDILTKEGVDIKTTRQNNGESFIVMRSGGNAEVPDQPQSNAADQRNDTTDSINAGAGTGTGTANGASSSSETSSQTDETLNGISGVAVARSSSQQVHVPAMGTLSGKDILFSGMAVLAVVIVILGCVFIKRNRRKRVKESFV